MAIFQQGVFSIGGGTSGKPVPLLSITTAPSAPFEKGSKYYDGDSSSETYQKILTAVEDDTWENAKVSDPSWGTYYLYDGHAYVWDGNSLEYFELNDYQQTKDKTDSYTSNSKTTYPNSYALKEGLARKQDIANISTSFDGTTATDTNYPSTKAVVDYVNSQGIARNFDDLEIDKTTHNDYILELARQIQGKHLTNGTILYGEIRNADLPFNGNAEVRVEILETKSGASQYQVIEFTLFSTNVAPNSWTYLYYGAEHSDPAQDTTAITWIPVLNPTDDYTLTSVNTYPSSKALSDGLATKQDTLTAGANISIVNNVISATDTTYTAGAGIAINGTTISATDALPVQTDNSGKVLTTDGTNTSWQYTAQFVSGTTQNDIEIGSGPSYEIDWDNLQFGDRLDNKATYIGTFHAQDPNQTAQDYAVFVLDAQYRDIKYIGDLTASLAGLPEYTTSNVISDAHESATYNTNIVINNVNSNLIPAFTFAHSMSVVVNGTTFYGQIPNCYELDVIWKNKTEIDNADPTVSSYSTMSISNFGGGNFACGSNFADNYDLGYFKGANYNAGAPWNLNRGDLFTIPVFEIPIPLPATRYINVNRLKVNGVIYQIQDKSQFNVVTDVTSNTDPALALTDNTYYTFSDAITSLTLSNIPVVNLGPIEILFTADTGFAGVTFPQGTLYTGTIPAWEAGKTYLISIQRGIVVAAEIKSME